ncbi:hypothetical protein VTJ83DRAFT_3444 [Remersonia thermophila]|uniref:Uncharacterized protein n=1 Tax=Remersonia thermophila TaxID=72144 RepID=A0ABR4DDZ5_9PEZI
MDNPSAERKYKAELDRLASSSKSPPQHEDASIASKVAQYVPAVGKLLGGTQTDPSERERSSSTEKPPGPPHRPIHDSQIEEFLRDQHRSERIVEAEEVTDA